MRLQQYAVKYEQRMKSNKGKDECFPPCTVFLMVCEGDFDARNRYSVVA